MSPRIDFETHPDRYRHWELRVADGVATLAMGVDEAGALDPDADYELKLNSYDLGVDIELADALQRVRFEHPEVRALVVRSARDDVFCSGANIYMLRDTSHGLKVNFCKFTNETRLYLEELSAESHIPTVAALSGTASGGGYELALACDSILLQDDGNSAVSLPEVPLLGVLPGTGGLTRLVDKRRVRRDRADFFATTAEGVRGRRAVAWGLVDAVAPRSRFDDTLASMVEALAAPVAPRSGPGVALPPLAPARDAHATHYEFVTFRRRESGRVADLVIEGPREGPAKSADALRAAGAQVWPLRVFRELDDTILDLRLNHPDVGVLVVSARGDLDRVLGWDEALAKFARDDWFAREIVLHTRRVLKRIDQSARSVFACIDPGSCFAGSLFELALAADRSFMLDEDGGPSIALSPLSFGALSMSNGLSRLETRFLGEPERLETLRESSGSFDAAEALEAGLVTFAPDDIDWDDEVRLAIEERAAFSPDALTGLEANLRFAGPETMETKIFGRLTAWQNWIFQRPNAVGDSGALSRYGSTKRPEFDPRRT